MLTQVNEENYHFKMRKHRGYLIREQKSKQIFLLKWAFWHHLVFISQPYAQDLVLLVKQTAGLQTEST